MIPHSTETTADEVDYRHYTSTNAFSSVRSGNYTCQAGIHSSSQFVTAIQSSSRISLHIHVGKQHDYNNNYYNNKSHACLVALPPPTDLTVVHSLPTSIHLSWSQPQGAEAVNGYKINYNYTIKECSRDNAGQAVQESVTVGNVTSYNLSNSSTAVVEEDSVYFITVTAVNDVTNSTSLATMANTSTAGLLFIFY